MFGMRDHDVKCSRCDGKSGGARLCEACEAEAIDAEAARLAATLLAIASSNPATSSDTPTRSPGTLEPLAVDIEDPHGLAGDW